MGKKLKIETSLEREENDGIFMNSQKPIFVRVTKKRDGLGANRMHTFPDDFKMYKCFNVLGRLYIKMKIKFTTSKRRF